MPEGPEVYITAKRFEKHFLNKNILSITSNTKTKVDVPFESKLIKSYSYGKVIILKTEGYYIHIHLGISGWFVFEKPRIYKYILNFSNKSIYLQDRRRFSSIKIFMNKEEHDKDISILGVDILTKKFTHDYFYKNIAKSKKNICSFIMNQKMFAGIGNYIKNDALYLSKISPYRKTNNLTKNEIRLLFKNILFVSFSNLTDWHKSYKVKISNEILKLTPEYIESPYNFYIFDREVDNYGNKVELDKKHCGRRTYFVKKIQK